MTQGKGVFSGSDIASLIRSGRIITHSGFSDDPKEGHVKEASLDVTVGEGEAYRIEKLLVPSGLRREKVRSLLPSMGARPITLASVLEPGNQYLVRGSASLAFPPGLYAYGNAKSTSGRNMLLSRFLVDGVEGYDTFDRRHEGWEGEVWLVLEPLVYPILLTDRESYAQIRFFDGDTRFNNEALNRELLTNDLILRQDGSCYRQGELSLFSHDGSVFTTLYARAGKLVGFRSKLTKRPLDLTARGLDPVEYFEPVYAEKDPSDPTGGMITLVPGAYYLLSTNETLHVPTHLCSELVALDPRLGLFFSHFAGFFDPGFTGVPTLEVTALRSTTLRHKQAVGRFRYEMMRTSTDSYNRRGSYADQKRTTLPKQFAMPEDWKSAMA